MTHRAYWLAGGGKRATKERVIEAIQSGVDDYIVKPLTIAQIQSKVYGVLIKKQVLL